jgi:hypothetical protein
MTRNVIAFQKGLIVVPDAGIDNRNLAMITQAELMRFGYMLDQDGLNQLGYADAADIFDFHNEVIAYLKDMTGGNRDYQPIYKGFPTQVMEMSEYELWVNQLVGYWSGGSFAANDWTKTKGTAFEQVKYKEIISATEQQFSDIFKGLVSSGTSLTPNDSNVIEWFITNYTNLEFPDFIPFKENMCAIFGLLFKLDRQLGSFKIPKLTTTDVLRIAVYLSGGNTALPAVPNKKVKFGNRWSRSWIDNPEREAFKFKKFKRSERRFILGLLEASNLDIREMKLKDQRWIRLGEILHPGEYKLNYPKTYAAFQRIRETKVISWYGEVNAAFKLSFDVGLAKLSERPGEFMRRLDVLIRANSIERVQKVLDMLSKIGEKSSNKVLFEVYDHFEDRKSPVYNRKVMIKGARKHTDLPTLPAIDKEKVDLIQESIFSIVKSKFASLPAMGDCWIDEELKKIPLPTNMRSLNDTLVPTIRGQRMPFGEGKKVLRPYIHWFDPNGQLDIDLHGFLFSETKDALSFGYNGIHNSSLGCYSGDVRKRQGACAEYVDINVEAATKAGYKYFLMIAHNFQDGKLSDIKDCVVGIMEREYPEANYNWKPDTIANAMKVQGASQYCLIGAFDLETREYIHLDIDFDHVSRYVNRGNSALLWDAISPFITVPKVSVYDLLQWHVEARGRMTSKETAETHFLFSDFATSYTKTIEYLGV